MLADHPVFGEHLALIHRRIGRQNILAQFQRITGTTAAAGLGQHQPALLVIGGKHPQQREQTIDRLKHRFTRHDRVFGQPRRLREFR